MAKPPPAARVPGPGWGGVGVVSQRDRRFTPGGLRQVYDFLWDGDDRLRRVDEAGTKRFSASYNGDGPRVKKEDTRGGLGLQLHNYSYGPTGLLHEDNHTAIYTPGFGHRSNGVSKFYHHDWLGSTRYNSDITGNTFPQGLRFDAFGTRSATGGTDPYRSTDLQFAGVWDIARTKSARHLDVQPISGYMQDTRRRRRGRRPCLPPRAHYDPGPLPPP